MSKAGGEIQEVWMSLIESRRKAGVTGIRREYVSTTLEHLGRSAPQHDPSRKPPPLVGNTDLALAVNNGLGEAGPGRRCSGAMRTKKTVETRYGNVSGRLVAPENVVSVSAPSTQRFQPGGIVTMSHLVR